LIVVCVCVCVCVCERERETASSGYKPSVVNTNGNLLTLEQAV